MEYISNPSHKKKCRKRNIVWFNPPYSAHVANNIGKDFFRLLDQHFPPHHRLYKICNRNNVKLSYSCMPNMGNIITKHNRRLLDRKEIKEASPPACNCKKKPDCPLDGSFREKSVVYKASVSTGNSTKYYYGCCRTEFKSRFYNHIHTFKHRAKMYSTELSKTIWRARDNGHEPQVTWSIVKRASTYSGGSRNCDLCLTEKLVILQADHETALSKRSELTGKCRHKNKYKLVNYGGPTATPD